jgi:5-methylcytosine-specific restriction enzyme subunit McrC
MRTIVLSEYQTSEPHALSVTERDALRAMVPGLVVQPVSGSSDEYTLLPGSTVGVARVDDLTVELRPKVGLAAVLFLVSYSLDPRAWKEPDAPLAASENLAEAIIPLFVRAAQDAIRPGLLHGYRRHDEALTTVRGRIRMEDQFRRRQGLPLPVEVSYDDFTPDVLENRLLRTAVDVLGRLRLRYEPSRRSLARLHQQLAGITPVPVTSRDVPEPLWTRLNEHYRIAVSLARIIISRAALEARAGGQNASVFLIDMNKVFEDFVRVALKEALGLSAREFPQGAAGHRLSLDDGGQVDLRPDLSWWHHGTCVFVGDCKYKKTNGAVPNADVYQMLAYLTALDLDEGLLVYARGEDQPRELNVRTALKKIHVRTIDVSQDPLKVLQDVDGLASLVRTLRLRAMPLAA